MISEEEPRYWHDAAKPLIFSGLLIVGAFILLGWRAALIVVAASALWWAEWSLLWLSRELETVKRRLAAIARNSSEASR